MSDRPDPPSSARHAVFVAYAVLLDNFRQLGGMALLLAVMITAFNWAILSGLQVLIRWTAGVSLTTYAPPVATLIVPIFIGLLLAAALATSTLLSVAVHRLIVLQQPIKLIPADRTVLIRYFSRMLVLVAPSIAVVELPMFASGMIDQDSYVLLEVVASYIVAPLVWAATVRWQLALVSTAVGREDLDFGRSWALTRGSMTPLFLGILACELPFGAASYGLEWVGADPDYDSVESHMLSLAFYAVEFLGDIVSAAFISFAYLHFTSHKNDAQAIASHFA